MRKRQPADATLSSTLTIRPWACVFSRQNRRSKFAQILEKISDIEKEIAKTQKNKATEHHLGMLKAKLAKYRVQLLEPDKKAGAKGEGFDVMKSGDARVVMIGFPVSAEKFQGRAFDAPRSRSANRRC
jgi:hypothetical protein